jgi:hypothetical protein
VTEQEFYIEALALVDDYINDWCLFAKDVLGASLDPEQQEILRAVQYHKRVTVRSGTSRGKDFVSAVASLCFMYLTPEWNEKGEMISNTKVAMTAPTDRQIGNIMFPEISRLYKRAKASGFDLPGRLTGHDIRTDTEEWFLTGFKADENNTEAWTGFHAANVMFVVTEASGIDDKIFNAIEGNLQGNSRLLIVFNDNTGVGYAAQSQRQPGWKKFRLDSLNAPNVLQRKIIIPGQVDWEWIDDKIDKWCTAISKDDFNESEGDFWWDNPKGNLCYRPNDLFRVKVRGMAPRVSSGALIPQEWIEAAVDRWKLQHEQGWKLDKSSLRLGVDVAGMGRDSSSFCYRFKNYVDRWDMIHSGGTANHMQIAGKTKQTMDTATDRYAGTTAQSFIDTIGEGAGVYSRLIELSEQVDYSYLEGRIHSVKFSEAAKYEGRELKDFTGQYSFINMRAYLFWAVRDWLNPYNKTGAMLPPDEEFSQEATEIQWKFRSDGKVQIEEKDEIKKRIGRSIDKFDALANTFYPAPDVDPTPEKKQKLANYFF